MLGTENRTRAVVEAIAHHEVAYGYPPTIRELMKETGLRSTSAVAYRLDVCESLGLIERAPRLARAVTLTAAGRALAGLPPERDAPAAGSPGKGRGSGAGRDAPPSRQP